MEALAFCFTAWSFVRVVDVLPFCLSWSWGAAERRRRERPERAREADWSRSAPVRARVDALGGLLRPCRRPVRPVGPPDRELRGRSGWRGAARTRRAGDRRGSRAGAGCCAEAVRPSVCETWVGGWVLVGDS